MNQTAVPRSRRSLIAIGVVVILLGAAAIYWISPNKEAPLINIPADPSVELPAGVNAALIDPTIEVGAAGGPAVDALGSVARILGGAVKINIKTAVEGAVVHFPVDLNADLPQVGSNKATTANLFIAVYNDDLQLWLPLPTTYDAPTASISAVAPHFSWFNKMVVDPATAIWSTSVDGVTAFAATIGNGIRDRLEQWWSPEQQSAGCDATLAQNPSVSFDLDALHGCIQQGGEDDSLGVENHLLVPVDLLLPEGADPEFETAALAEEEIADLIARLIDQGLGQAFVAGHGASRVALTPELATTPRWSGTANVNMLAIAAKVILSILAVLPAEAKFEESVLALRVTVTKFAATKGSFTFIELGTELEQQVKTLSLGPGVNLTSTFVEALTCMQHWVSDLWSAAGHPFDEHTVSNMLNYARACVSTAIERLGESLASGTKDFLKVLAGIPNLASVGRELVQFVQLGPRQMSTAMNVTYEAPSEPAPSCPADGGDEIGKEDTAYEDLVESLPEGSLSSGVLSLCGPDAVITASPTLSSTPSIETIQAYAWLGNSWGQNGSWEPGAYMPQLAAGERCIRDCIVAANLTGSELDVLIPGASADATGNGLTVLRYDEGKWRQVPFYLAAYDEQINYLTGAHLEGGAIVSENNNCVPSCADGTYQSQTLTYDQSREAFVEQGVHQVPITTFSATAVEEEVIDILTTSAPNGYGLANVSSAQCPDGQPVSKGTTFDCKVTVEGLQRTVLVTVTGDENNASQVGMYTVGFPR